jgi:nucleoside-triphosphatase
MNILITGPPGVGKTTVLNKTKDVLESNGYKIGGVFCPEIKKNDKRVGFSIIDVMSKEKGVLSHLDCKGPRIGRYKVNLKDLNEIGAFAIEEAIKKADYIIIDEIGPMELHGLKFCDATRSALKSEKPVVAVIHKKSRHPFIVEIKDRADVQILEVSTENRDFLHDEILKILKY